MSAPKDYSIIGKTIETIGKLLFEDDKTKVEFFDYDNEKNKFDINLKKSHLRAKKRVNFFTFLLVWVWLLAVLFIVICDSIQYIPGTSIDFESDSSVLITLITTTTINVIALVRIVVKSLFPINSEKYLIK